MLISDFLASQAPHSDDLAWVGSTLPAHPALVAMPVADSDKLAPVQVAAIRVGELPGCLDCMDGLAEGDRAVVLTDALPAEPTIRQLVTVLAERGFEVLHAVYLDDAASIHLAGGLSVQRTGSEPGGPDLVTANLHAVTVDTTEPNWERARAAFLKLAAHQESMAEKFATLEAELRSVTAHRELAEKRLESVRNSTTMQVGRAIVEVARHPVRGARRSARIVRTALRARRQPPPRPVPRRRGTRDGKPWLDFRAPMPVPPGSDRRQAAPLHVDVPASYIVARHLRKGGIGGYEPSMMAWYLALCDTAQPGAVWDIGSNLGPYALLARAYGDREVVAFEPTPDLARWAAHLSAINDLDYRLEQIAAGEFAGTATFYLSDSSDSSNSLAEGFRASTRQLDVLVEPLDRYSRRTGSVPAVIKIDTETTEHLVLHGMREVVTRHRPWIFCEVLANRAPEKPLTELMSGVGYRFYHLDGSIPLPERDVVRGDPTFKHMNYLFAPAEIGDRTVEAARAWQDALAATHPPG